MAVLPSAHPEANSLTLRLANLHAESFGDGVAAEVVFGGAEAAHDGDQIGAAQRGADGVDQVALAVADDSLEGHGNADLIELFSQVKRVGVLAIGSKQLRTNRNDLGVHG